ncbi:MAG: DUF2726 domain-containing protein, partial [Clostridia bacterium]
MEIQINIQYLSYFVIFLCFAYIIKEKFRYVRENEDPKVKDSTILPYTLVESVLTRTELAFYTVLKTSVGRKAIICPKVGLREIFFVDEEVGKEYMRYFGKISRKHVDFLLCDPITMKPICGIELNQIGRIKKDRQERAEFVNKVYSDAHFTLIRVPSKTDYTKKEVDSVLKNVFAPEAESVLQ